MRVLVALCCTLIAWTAALPVAFAQSDFPARPITIVVVARVGFVGRQTQRCDHLRLNLGRQFVLLHDEMARIMCTHARQRDLCAIVGVAGAAVISIDMHAEAANIHRHLAAAAVIIVVVVGVVAHARGAACMIDIQVPVLIDVHIVALNLQVESRRVD